MPTNNPEDSRAILGNNPDALNFETSNLVDNETIADVEININNPVGRPTDYGPAVVQKLTAAIQRLMTVTEACHYAGISTSTYYDWIVKYPEFSDKMDKAKTYLFRMSKDIISDDITTNKDVRTAKWLLEKKDPDFNPRTKVDLTGDIEITNKDDLLLEFLNKLVGEDADEPNTNTETPSS